MGSTASEESGLALSAATPRSDEEVERVAGPSIQRIRRFARNLGIAFIAPTLLLGVVFLFARPEKNPADARAMVGGVVAAFVFMGLLPAWVVRRMVGADARRIERGVRYGVAFRGEVTGRGATNAQTTFLVRWREGTADATAAVRLPGRTGEVARDVTVLVSSETAPWVVVALGGAGLHAGRRRR